MQIRSGVIHVDDVSRSVQPVQDSGNFISMFRANPPFLSSMKKLLKPFMFERFNHMFETCNLFGYTCQALPVNPILPFALFHHSGERGCVAIRHPGSRIGFRDRPRSGIQKFTKRWRFSGFRISLASLRSSGMTFFELRHNIGSRIGNRLGTRKRN